MTYMPGGRASTASSVELACTVLRRSSRPSKAHTSKRPKGRSACTARRSSAGLGDRVSEPMPASGTPEPISTVSTLASVITIPGDAVQYGTSRTYVYVIADGKSYTREVTLGATADNRVEVVSGINEGDLVVLEGLDRLRDGKEVIIPDETGTQATGESGDRHAPVDDHSPDRNPS